MFCQNLPKKLVKFCKIRHILKLANMWQNFEIAEPCKGVHCVDLGESFQTHIFLQNFASTQPRTSPQKFAQSSVLTADEHALRCTAQAMVILYAEDSTSLALPGAHPWGCVHPYLVWSIT